MSIEITKAIKSRWVAKSLSSYITGGVHHSRAPERASMPYCIFTEFTNSKVAESRSNRYFTFGIQFDVYTDDGDAETAADLADTVRAAFTNAENAIANPLIPAGEVLIVDARLISAPVTTMESDQVFRSMFQMLITWAESRVLAPA